MSPSVLAVDSWQKKAAEDRQPGKQDASDRRPPGARAAGSTGHVEAAGPARPRDAGHAALSRPAPRRAVRAAPGRPAGPPRRAAPASARQGQQNPLRAQHPIAAGAIADYLEAADHDDDKATPLFRPVSNNARGVRAITPDGVYRVLAKYAGLVGIDIDGFGPHALRATAITNALDNNADLAKVQVWVGHANVSTTRMYDRRQARPEDSPTFKVAY